MCVLFSLSLSPDIKPEQVALGRLREAEDVCWRLVMDLERVLCYSAAKINQTVYMGHMMVCGTVSGPLLDSFVVCGRLVTTTTCTLLITPPPPPVIVPHPTGTASQGKLDCLYGILPCRHCTNYAHARCE